MNLFNKSIKQLLYRAIRVTLMYPKTLLFIIAAIKNQKIAVKKRLKNKTEEFNVPPIIILSVTNKCNLNCGGCYYDNQERSLKNIMDDDLFCKILNEANDLGVSIMLLAGGEPLIRENLLEDIKSRTEIIFPLFTNGLLIDDKRLDLFDKHRHIVPVISIEGYEEETDKRRGSGVYKKLQEILSLLRKKRIIYGISVTVSKNNFDTVVNHEFIKTFSRKGCGLFFFIEYVPFEPGTEELILSGEHRIRLKQLLKEANKKYNVLIVSFPGDEDKYGGCLGAGRGFIHINADGSVEACPFSPFSDVNLKNSSIKDACNSKLLKTIRKNSDNLNETKDGCVLWKKRDWIRSLVH